MKHMSWTMALLAALVGFPVLTACSMDAEGGDQEATARGTVSMALSTITNGTEYRLSNAVFQINGVVSTSLASSNDPMEVVLSATLPVGSYTSSLANGWSLQRNDGGTFVNVQATLVSANPASFDILDGAATPLVYQFDTDGTIISIGAGQLDISIGVNETNTVACTAFGAGCDPAAQWCAPAVLFGGGDNQCVPTGSLQSGQACMNPFDCTFNTICGDIGDGQGSICHELCPAANFGAPCAFGGGVCTSIGDPTTGLCQ